jgi:hypothetical protein
MLPGGGPVGMFGAADGSDRNWVMRQRRLGFVALFGYEQAVLLKLQELQRLMGMVVPTGDGRWSLGAFEAQRTERYFSYAEQTRDAD